MKASDYILRKALVAAGIPSKDWATIHAGLRNRAFFMSRVMEQRILYAARQGVADVLDGKKDRSEVRRDLRKLISLEDRPDDEQRGTIQDIFTKRRLDVMIDTNVRQAKGYAEHIRATSRGALMAFPAYELFRERQSKQPRDWNARWAKAANEVGWEGVARNGKKIALKTSPIWTKLSAFGNPFPPFDWGSGMGIEDVERSVCIELGLVGDGIPEQEPPKLDLNGHLQADIPDTRRDSLCGKTLTRIFGDQISIDNSKVRWQGNLIQDVLAGRVPKARLGKASEATLEMLSKALPKEDVEVFKGMNPSFNANTFNEHAIKHFADNEKRASNIPLTASDYELIPTIWRSPDRVVKVKDHHAVLEFNMLDGSYLQLAMNTMRGFASFYKTKIPLGATPGNAPFIP